MAAIPPLLEMHRYAQNQAFCPKSLSVGRLRTAGQRGGQQMGEAREKGAHEKHQQLLLRCCAAELLGRMRGRSQQTRPPSAPPKPGVSPRVPSGHCTTAKGFGFFFYPFPAANELFGHVSSPPRTKRGLPGRPRASAQPSGKRDGESSEAAPQPARLPTLRVLGARLAPRKEYIL